MRRLIAFPLLLLAHVTVFAGDLESDWLDNWPQWRGPLATGVAPNADPPLSWDQETNVKWKTKLEGSGTASPIVWGDQIFIVAAVETDREEEQPPEKEPEAPGGNVFGIKRPTHYYKFLVLSYDRRTGDKVWEQLATEQVPHEGAHRDHGFASATPVTDGRHVYAYFGSRGIYCYDMEGNLEWDRDLGDMQMYRFFGEGSSPVLHGDTLIINWDHEGDSFLFALDTKTGETKWQVPREEHSSWATPLVVEYGGKTQVVVNGQGKARGYDLANGDVLWECGGQVLAIIPTPVAYEGLVFCMSGYQGAAMFAIPLDSTGDITDSDKIAWSRDRDAPYCPSPLLLGDKLYFNKTNSNVLTCLDARTGEPYIEKERLPDLKGIYSSPVAAAGRIYFTGRDGTTDVIADAPKLEVLSSNKLDDPIDASPALVGGDIILRSKNALYCISEQ